MELCGVGTLNYLSLFWILLFWYFLLATDWTVHAKLKCFVKRCFSQNKLLFIILCEYDLFGKQKLVLLNFMYIWIEHTWSYKLNLWIEYTLNFFIVSRRGRVLCGIGAVLRAYDTSLYTYSSFPKCRTFTLLSEVRVITGEIDILLQNNHACGNVGWNMCVRLYMTYTNGANTKIRVGTRCTRWYKDPVYYSYISYICWLKITLIHC